MTIPNDIENRWWVEASSINPSRVNELRPGLLIFVAFDAGGEASIVGTGFIIAGDPNFAAVMTAKHVLSEGVLSKQKPNPSYAPSALFVPKSSTTPSIEPRKLKAFWMGSENAFGLDIANAEYNDSLDIACCLVAPQESEETLFEPISLPIDTAIPRVGDEVHMVSQDGLKISTENLENNRLMRIARRISIRVGVVTGVYPNGFRQYSWPCFTTSIPAEPGMSGGLVVLPVDGKTIAACGIVCADNSEEKARVNPLVCGESVIACTWPALGMRLPESLPACTTTTRRSLLEFMQSGNMPMAVGGIDHINIVEKGDGDYSILRC